MKWIGVFLLSFSVISLSEAQLVIDNVEPRMDQHGQIVDLHDGRVVKYQDRYYWYGTSYGSTNGFTKANRYHCYSSPDMSSWKNEGPLLADAPAGVYYRPHVIYNKATNVYVLWYNWYAELWDGRFGVAISENPEGPFKIVNDDVKMYRSKEGLGDFGLFVDDDGIAYISYNTISNHRVSIEKLTEDYTSSTMINGGVIDEHMEAGSMFKRGDYYYLLTDYTCCFCNQGSGARVYMSKDPLQGYEYTGNINRYPGSRTLRLNDGELRNNLYEQLEMRDSSWSYIEMVFDGYHEISQVDVGIFTGNRAGRCGDVDHPEVHAPIKVPSFSIEYLDGANWRVIPDDLVLQDESSLHIGLTLQLDGVKARRLRVKPSKDNSFDRIDVSEIKVANSSGQLQVDEMDIFLAGRSIAQRPIIPAQQTYVLQLGQGDEVAYIWMGDLWGSASDNIKGHDYQYWSAPLKFLEDGTILPMRWVDEWSYSFAD